MTVLLSGTQFRRGTDMKIAIVWAMGGPKSWNDLNLESGIGGSEGMIILRARALVSLGHEVVCFAPGNSKESVHHGVLWKSLPSWPFPTDTSYAFGVEGFDAIVALRRAGWGYSTTPLVRALWASDQGCYDLEKAVGDGQCNLIFVESECQRELFQRQYPSVPNGLYVMSSAGVAFDEYEPDPVKDPLLCLYSSTPERGLRQLIRQWYAIHNEIPDAQLLITGGFELYGMTPERAAHMSEGLYRIVASLPRARYLGPIPRSELIALQLQASLLLYPSVYDEMCCIAALEMHAAGCAIVTTERAALAERVRDGIDGYLIPGTPGTPAYDEFFLERVIELLRNPERARKFGRAGREEARKYDHKVLAKQWVDIFQHMIGGST